ncbi:helix-turn-helix domain-containing protein [Mangrovibacillus cuniculi]|uniref:Helicase Helix-turn-helix domain-containing protein n=1 Tax=Mangrovibacillus cuniculi TaxID=2593652 RepID=A0A7S8HFP3_9BACI|nr:helix-turn-helix domain-containing protein [Mangrovibacillus cuniculi]QPC46731.1 hypothetical protein G8O30_07020 [Mangrovibacillus cuniculi]
MDKLILTIATTLHEQRSYSSIFHILKGKKSSQTIQDIHLFSLTAYFSILPKLSKEQFMERLNSLRDDQYISLDTELIKVTSSGLNKMHNAPILFPFLNGWSFHKVTKERWEKMNLLIQVVSNALSQNKNYIPIVQDEKVQKELKFFLASHLTSQTLKEFAHTLLEECSVVFEEMETAPTLLIKKLSGVKTSGQTMYQLADEWNVSEIEMQLMWLHAWHEWMAIYERLQPPLLSMLLQTTNNVSLYTSSTQHTKRLLDMGNSLEDVASIRGLKKSTIEDHVIELALMDPHFDSSILLTQEEERLINEAIETLQVQRLKPIKESVGDAISYFQIRLCIARRGKNELT